MKKTTLYTLNIPPNGHGEYAPDITAITYPLLKHYAKRLNAEFFIITERRYPDWPIVYEKLQIKRLAEERGDDLSIYLDSDALVHPETPDFSHWIPRDTVAHNGTDFAPVRWRYDKYFRRDGRHIGSCNWNTWAWQDCVDLWTPLDIPFEEARENIYPIVDEIAPQRMKPITSCPTCHFTPQQTAIPAWEDGKPVLAPQVVDRDHLIDDYALSRNIARFGLKCTTLMALQEKIGQKDAAFFWHNYIDTNDEKVVQMREVLIRWRVDKYMERFK